MRRFAASWQKVSNQLGLTKSHRRPARLAHGGLQRRLRFEPLEDRRMLADFTVVSAGDNADSEPVIVGSLRWAIDQANLIDDHDDIYFDLNAMGSNEVQLQSAGQLTISNPVTIHGPAPEEGVLTIRAWDPTPVLRNGDGNRIFQIEDGASGATIGVIISSLSLTGGDIQDYDAGGAVLNYEVLSLIDAVIYNNLAGSGGGVYSGGSLTVDRCSISNNSAYQGGGGILATSRLSIIDSTISHNQTGSPEWAMGLGGGICWGSDLSSAEGMLITRTTVSHNTAWTAGGGINIGSVHEDGPVEITDSTISDNAAGEQGGGINVDHYLGSVYISNSTISTNQSDEGGGLQVWSQGADYVTNVTITDNLGGGLRATGHSVCLVNSIVSGNTDMYGTTPYNINGNLNPASFYNLVGTHADGGLKERLGNILGVDDPLLGPLQDNGGATWTHMPQGDSPAIDTGRPSYAYAEGEFDQRGETRVRNGRIDIGAVETAGPIVAPPAPSAQPLDLSTFVPNLDFEDYIRLPTGYSDMPVPDQTVVAWSQLAYGSLWDCGTTDYLHVDGFSGWEGPAYAGIAPPPSNGSHGFVGVISDYDFGNSGYYEYAVDILPSSLAPGQEYRLDLFAGTTSEGSGFGGPFDGDLVVYGLLDASLIMDYYGDYDPIDVLAGANVVELLSIDVDLPASEWTHFLNQSIAPTVPIEAIVFGSRSNDANTYLLIDASASAFPPQLTGDYNEDGTVDAADYTVWRDHLGQWYPLPNEDPAVTPGHVTDEDYAVWKTHFGETSQAPGRGAVGSAATELAVASPVETVVDAVSDDINASEGAQALPINDTSVGNGLRPVPLSGVRNGRNVLKGVPYKPRYVDNMPIQSRPDWQLLLDQHERQEDDRVDRAGEPDGQEVHEASLDLVFERVGSRGAEQVRLGTGVL